MRSRTVRPRRAHDSQHKAMPDDTQALASLRFVSRWGYLLIGIPAISAAIVVGYIVWDAAVEGYAEVVAASACTVADAVLDTEQIGAVLPASQGAQLDSVVQTRDDAGSICGMRVANSEGLVVYSTKPGEAGRELNECGESQGALAGNLHREVVGASGLATEDGRLLKVCAPLRLDGGGDVDGFLVAVQSYEEVAPSIRKSVGASVATVLGAALLAFVGLQLVVRRSISQIERDQEDVELLNHRLAMSASEMEEQALGTFQALLSAVDAKDSYTAAHSVNVAELALAINCHLQNPADSARLERAALLHDIGKIGVSETILSKPAKLDHHEWSSMRDHPGSGADILAAVPFMAGIVDTIRHHHERWDGAGYPDRLTGEETPLEARILAVADSFDAMTTERPYSPAMSPEQAREEIRRCTGTQFDPLVVEAFLEAYDVQGLRWISGNRPS
jgi:putative nucleotidyltransferase with HDIG domain